MLSIELTDFEVFYNEGNHNINEELQAGKSKIIVENGELVEKRKDKEGNVTENILTQNWHDWIDYWSVDFDYESKPEVIKFKKKMVLLKRSGQETMFLKTNGNHSEQKMIRNLN